MSQKFTKLNYHLIWSTKYRAQKINLRWKNFLKNFLRRKIFDLGGYPIKINMAADHVHVLTTIPARMSVAEFVKYLKGSSTHEMNSVAGKQFFAWQAGYSAFTVSEGDVGKVRKYVENQ
ncbi:IS200/IS605 family transposase [Patescibacteria group bacterium]